MLARAPPAAYGARNRYDRRVTSEPLIFDRRLLMLRRNRVAAGAGRHDFLLARVADDLAERLLAINRQFPLALNLGAYHGLLSRRLRTLSGVGLVIDMEPARGLLAQCDGPKIQADEEALPFADQSLELVVSGLSLQLVNDLPGVLIQIRRALAPDGLLLAALLGGATLNELRTALLLAEAEIEGGASPRVAPFADVRDLGALLQRAEFALPVADAETVTVTYAHPLALDARVARHGRKQCLARPPQDAAAPRDAHARCRDLRRPFRPFERPRAGDLRDHHLDRLGAAFEPAAAARPGLGQAAPCRRARHRRAPRRRARGAAQARWRLVS